MTMNRRLHLFFPENDLALVADNPHYTPPDAALNLHRAGEALPIWYGAPGDMFLTGGISDKWLRSVESMFDPGIGPYDHTDTRLESAPWGWSKASRQYFADNGIVNLPDDNTLNRIRHLSHRRTASEITKKLQAALPFATTQPAKEVSDPALLPELVKEYGTIAFKSPWSSSGRGLIIASVSSPQALITQAAGVIRRQGSIMAEQFYLRKAADFAMLFESDGNGTFSNSGLSLFNTNDKGAYTGNILTSDSDIEKRLSGIYPSENLTALRQALPSILTQTLGNAYSGPLGIDMMIVYDNDGTPLLDACVEVNLRMTMGHVANRFYKRFCADGITGRFEVLPVSPGTTPEPALPEVCDRKLTGGSLDLVPPGNHFSFRVTVDQENHLSGH